MRHLISNVGSDRGTGYNVSNRMIRRDGKLLIGWLDAPPTKGEQVQAMLGVCDLETGVLQHAFPLGGGIDNHCGSALAQDANGRVHAVVGAHHGPFIYRYSDDPKREETWSDPELLGHLGTYPSLVVDGEGTLHLAHRERGDRWHLLYRRKKAGQAWETPRVMAISPTAGYNHFMQSLAVGPTGDIHLVFQFHFAESGNAADCRGRAAVYVKSSDGGDTWENEGQRVDDPITLDTMQAVCHAPDGGDGRHSVRVGNLVVDAHNQPWFFCSFVGHESGVIWWRKESGWQMIDLADRLDGLNMEGGRSTSLSRDGAGHIHFAFATDPTGKRCQWFAPSLEVFHLVLDAEGNRVSLTQVTDVDNDAANWLPALELWDWTRPDQTYEDGHFLMYTRGLNAGGIGGDNKSALKTEIMLTK